MTLADKAHYARMSAISKALNVEKDIEVLSATQDVREIEAHIKNAQVLVMDAVGDTARLILDEMNRKKLPVIAIVENAAQGFAMLEWGAAQMQLFNDSQDIQFFCKMLTGKIRSVAKSGLGKETRKLKRPNLGRVDKVIAIGSSTGGTDTLEYIMKRLPEDMPPILVVQHMPPIFTKMFAERLHSACRISVWEAQDGDALERGLAFIAPGDRHMVLFRSTSGLQVKLLRGEKVCNQRPAVDVLFESVAKTFGRESVFTLGVILTGMGSDGARGMLTMRKMGAKTIGQNEESCVVYGMPKVAHDIGAVQKQLHLNDIAQAIIDFAKT